MTQQGSSFVGNDTVREDLPDGTGFIDVRTEISWGDVIDTVDEALNVSDAEGQVTLRLGRMQGVQLRAGIAGWGGDTFNGPDGKPVPVTVANLRKLKPERGAELARMVRKHHPDLLQKIMTMGKESTEKKAEEPAGSPSSSVAAGA